MIRWRASMSNLRKPRSNKLRSWAQLLINRGAVSALFDSASSQYLHPNIVRTASKNFATDTGFDR